MLNILLSDEETIITQDTTYKKFDNLNLFKLSNSTLKIFSTLVKVYHYAIKFVTFAGKQVHFLEN